MTTENLKLIIPDGDDTDILNWMASLYSHAFSTGAWAGEHHDADNSFEKIQAWIKDKDRYRVMCGMLNNEPIGFAVTRRELLPEAVLSLFTELKEVSGITLDEDEKDDVSSKLTALLDNTSVEGQNAVDSSSHKVGFFQDVAIFDWYRGQGYYNQLMLPLTIELLDDDDIRLMIVYTNLDVAAVVKTLQDFGGVLIYEGDILVYAATTDTIKNKMAELGLTS